MKQGFQKALSFYKDKPLVAFSSIVGMACSMEHRDEGPFKEFPYARGMVGGIITTPIVPLVWGYTFIHIIYGQKD